ncbi:MAG: hypothetical protein NC091_05545 [Bacteroides sp.]|nr:hypothetical protein [Bacteroides sp.]
MGKFSQVFTKAKSGIANIGHGFTGKGRTGYFSVTQKWNRSHQKRGGYAGGWAAIAFGNIINAHSSPEDVVETFSLDKENDYGCTAYADAFKEQYDIAEQIYQEWVDYYLGIIDMLTAEMNECLNTAEELEQAAQELKDEAESLRDEAEWADDPEEAEELLEEAEALEQEAAELLEQAEALRTEAAELQMEIEHYDDEIDMLNIEEFIDYDTVESNAFEYACEFAQQWIDGSVWISPDVLSWAFYEVSDHNG